MFRNQRQSRGLLPAPAPRGDRRAASAAYQRRVNAVVATGALAGLTGRDRVLARRRGLRELDASPDFPNTQGARSPRMGGHTGRLSAYRKEP